MAVKKFIVFLLLTISFISCRIERERDINDYCGCQIVEKGRYINNGDMWFKFRKNKRITKQIYFVEYDWNRYIVGDTIICN